MVGVGSSLNEAEGKQNPISRLVAECCSHWHAWSQLSTAAGASLQTGTGRCVMQQAGTKEGLEQPLMQGSAASLPGSW